MFKHLLVPLDGSKLAEAVLPAVRRMASASAAAVTLFHILEKNPPEKVHGDSHLTDAAQAEEYLSDLAARLKAEGLAVDWHVHDVPAAGVAHSITAHAVELEVDLIVLATHGRGGLREMVYGSIAQQVVGRGTTPVLVIHPETAEDAAFPCQKLVAPVDGKEEHAVSVPVAAELARLMGASLQYVTVVPHRADLGGTALTAGRLLPNAMAALLEQRTAEAVEHLSELVANAKTEGVEASGRVERGEPVGVLLKVLKEANPDLLVLSTHTRKGWEAFWQGSVAPRLMTGWRRATLLIRAGATR